MGHDHVDALAQARGDADLGGIDDVELGLLLGEVAAHARRQLAGDLIQGPRAVHHADTPRLEVAP